MPAAALGSDRSPEEAEGAGEDEPNGGVLPGGVLEKTQKDHTREEMWAQAYARSARTTGLAYKMSPSLSESLSSPTALLCFSEIQGMLRPSRRA